MGRELGAIFHCPLPLMVIKKPLVLNLTEGFFLSVFFFCVLGEVILKVCEGATRVDGFACLGKGFVRVLGKTEEVVGKGAVEEEAVVDDAFFAGEGREAQLGKGLWIDVFWAGVGVVF